MMKSPGALTGALLLLALGGCSSSGGATTDGAADVAAFGDLGGFPTCTATGGATVGLLSASAFCMNYLATCTNVPGYTPPSGLVDEQTCENTYSNFAIDNVRSCVSYYLCWGVEGRGGGPADPATYCPDATGLGPCASSISTDRR